MLSKTLPQPRYITSLPNVHLKKQKTTQSRHPLKSSFYQRGKFLERGSSKGSGSDTICEVRPPQGTSLGRLCLHLQPSTACLITLSLMSQGGQTAYNQSIGSLSGLHSNSKTCLEFFSGLKTTQPFS